MKKKIVLIVIALLSISVLNAQNNHNMDAVFSVNGAVKVVYSMDSLGVIKYNKKVIDEILQENWNLKEENQNLKELYAKVLKIARDTRKELDKIKNNSQSKEKK